MSENEQNQAINQVNLAEESLPKRNPLAIEKLEDFFGAPEGFQEEPARVTAAFKEYVQMGKGRSLQRLAESLSRPENPDWTNNYDSVLRMVKDYSSKFGWQERLRQMITKASTEALAEAQREALRHTKERIKISVTMQKLGMSVIQAAKLDNLSVEEARRLLKPAAELVKLGLSSERAEAGDNLASIKPDKNPRDMTDEELEEYAEVLYRNLN